MKKKFVEKLAVVKKIYPNGTALCEQGVEGLCGACDSKGSDCHIEENREHSKAPVEFIIQNDFNAKIGQVVRVGIPDISVLLSAVVSYLIPLVFLVFGAVIGWMIGGEIVSIIGSLLGVLLGFCVSLILARYILKSIWSPKMLGVLNFNLCNK